MEIDDPAGERQNSTFAQIIPAISAAVAILVGIAVLTGWLLDLDVLKRILPGFVAMNPATAVCFILSGAALIFSLSADSAALWVRILGLVVLSVGVAKLLGLGFNWQTNVDQILFASKLTVADSLRPNRMAPNTALCFFFVGTSLISIGIGPRPFPFHQIAALCVGLLSLISLIGYLYGVRSFYGVASYIEMALHTAATFLILALGLFFVRPTAPLAQLFLTRASHGVLARRLIPTAVISIICFGWLRVWGEHQGYYSSEFGAALFAIVASAIFLAVIGWTISTVRRVEIDRDNALRATIEANVDLEETVRELELIINHARELICAVDQSGKVITMNAAAEAVLSMQPRDLVGRPFIELHAAENRPVIEQKIGEISTGLQTASFNAQCQRRDGSFVPIQWSIQFSRHHGRAFCVGREASGVG